MMDDGKLVWLFGSTKLERVVPLSLKRKKNWEKKLKRTVALSCFDPGHSLSAEKGFTPVFGI